MAEQGKNGHLVIAEVEASNFLIFEEISFKPRPHINVFTGKNSQGKTDVLKLIQAGLKGFDSKMIRNGAEKAQLMVRLNDGHQISRTVTDKTKRIQLKTPAGDIKASPQAWLNELLGDDTLLFDPIHFATMAPKQAKEYFMRTFDIGKVDKAFLEPHVPEAHRDVLEFVSYEQDGLSALKTVEGLLYSRRTEKNAEKNQKSAFLAEKEKQLGDFTLGGFEDRRPSCQARFDDAKIAVAKAESTKEMAEQNAATRQRLKESIQKIDSELETFSPELDNDLVDKKAKIDEVEEEIVKLRKRLEALRDEETELVDQMTKREDLSEEKKSKVEMLESITEITMPDIEALRKEQTAAEAALQEANVEASLADVAEEAETLREEADALKEASDVLTNAIKAFRTDLPLELTRDSKLPFDNIAFEGDDIRINGVLLQNMSTSEQLQVGLEIVRERTKDSKLKIICVDRIEVLDDESYEAFFKFCEDNGMQCFSTKVVSSAPQDSIQVDGGKLSQEVDDGKRK